ncbi:MAG: succinylglutamate desuccinylase/aspartoacylase family protein [Phycisphaeraceae bacterium]|nr:succinylglutamate desuccinylase/aspartoacylase family protein [Phycisphaeraceae bacterium]
MRPFPYLPLALCLLLAACSSSPRDNWKPLSSIDDLLSPSTIPSRAWLTLGSTNQRRPLEARTVGQGPTRVYLIAAIHGNEPEGIAAADRLARELIDSPHLTLRVVRDMNPDGTNARSRENARGVDLNRNWPASNFQPSPDNGPSPLSEPETAAVHNDLLAFAPDLVVVFHSTARANAPFVNYDGPAAALAHRWSYAARRVADGWSVVRDMGYPTPGSIGTFVGVDRRIPILTIEFAQGQDPESALTASRAGLSAVVDRLALARSSELVSQNAP